MRRQQVPKAVGSDFHAFEIGVRGEWIATALAQWKLILAERCLQCTLQLLHFEQLATATLSVKSRNALADKLIVNRMRPSVQWKAKRCSISFCAGKVHAILVEIVKVEPQFAHRAKQGTESGLVDDFERYDVVTVKARDFDAFLHFTK